MKAIVWTKYGSPDGLQLREVAIPAPKEDEVLINVHAATASQADTELRRLKLPLLFAIPLRLYLGFTKPTRITILGTEFAGEVVATGNEVTRYRPGDQVFGYTGLSMRTYAKHYGSEVTGVDKPGKLEMLRSIGADHVIDYTQEDFTRSGERYDVILDTAGKSSFSGSLRSLKENGTYLNANPGLFGGIRMRWVSRRSSKRVIPWTAGYTTDNLLALKKLIEAGTLKAIIDRRYPLEQAAEAHRYVETGEKKGNVVLTVYHAHET